MKKPTTPLFAPNGQLLSEILSGGKIVSYHLFADRDFETESQVGHVLLELHKSRRSSQPFGPCCFVAYECMYVNGEWVWYAMTFYRSTRAEAIKGLRQQYREQTRRSRVTAE